MIEVDYVSNSTMACSGLCYIVCTNCKLRIIYMLMLQTTLLSLR